MVGAIVTVKFDVLTAMNELTVTVMLPVVAPAGTVVVMLVVVAAVTMAAVPLNLTVLLAGVVLKFVPVIVTVVPTEPPVGVKLFIAGATIKLDALVPVREFTVTEMGPVVAALGTKRVMLDQVDVATGATVPLKLTVLLAGVALKFVPEIGTEGPIIPPAGEKLVMVGGTIKLETLVAVLPP